MPEIKRKSRPAYSDNHERTGNGSHLLNLQREIIDADTLQAQKLHIPQKPQTDIIYA